MAKLKQTAGSAALWLSSAEVQKVLKGAGIAALGGVVAWLSSQQYDLTTTQGIVLAAVSAAVVNFGRFFIPNTKA